MKGGEVTPLMASGALWGSWWTGLSNVATFQLGAALGLVSLFCARLRIPWTGAFLLLEIFDWRIALLGLPMLLLTDLSQRQILNLKAKNSNLKSPR